MLWWIVENHISEGPERVDTAIGLKPEVLDQAMKDPEMVASTIFIELI